VARIGILGGTFNPPHVGHLALATHALRQLPLERVALMPAFAAPHKPAGQDPGPAQRLEMCRMAACGAFGVSVCELEVERGGTSYTVDTLRAIAARKPDLEATLIVGADTARTLPSWREPAALLELAGLAVADRGGEGREQVLQALRLLGREPRVEFLEMPALDVSSSAVRALAAGGGEIEGLVGPAVASYIERHGLYREQAGTP
jgi:nicotinate-nucleotide adenylyltransferase